MTVETFDDESEVSSDLVVSDGIIPGLEDFDTTGLSIPRISIYHDSPPALWQDSLTDEKVPELNLIILGMVTQRILWGYKLNDTESPLCKSNNAEIGYPLLKPNGKENLIFPWDESSFDPDDMGVDLNGHRTLTCSTCSLKNWNKKNPPRCSEQITFAVIDTEGVGPSLLTMQKSSLLPTKRYLGGFFRRKEPLFMYVTNLTLITAEYGGKPGKSGKPYGIPVFTKGDKTDSVSWQTWADDFRALRDFMKEPPRSGNGLDEPDSEPYIDSEVDTDVVDAETVPEPVVRPATRQTITIPKPTVTRAPVPKQTKAERAEAKENELPEVAPQDLSDDDSLPF